MQMFSEFKTKRVLIDFNKNRFRRMMVDDKQQRAEE